MHMKGFSHRDLKCGNILLDSDYNLKICDMGFASHVSGTNRSGWNETYVGTVSHMSPQILERVHYKGVEADLFAMCFASGDQKEGMKAFLEKRSPEFKGQ